MFVIADTHNDMVNYLSGRDVTALHALGTLGGNGRNLRKVDIYGCGHTVGVSVQSNLGTRQDQCTPRVPVGLYLADEDIFAELMRHDTRSIEIFRPHADVC
jgi:hypothetical protein